MDFDLKGLCGELNERDAELFLNSAEVLTALSLNPDKFIEDTPHQFLIGLFRSQAIMTSSLKDSILQDPVVMQKIADHPLTWKRFSEIFEDPSTPLRFLQYILERHLFLTHHNLLKSMLEEKIIRDAPCSSDVIDCAILDPVPTLLIRAATHPNTSIAAQSALARDSRVLVRLALTQCPTLDQAVRAILRNDLDPRIKAALGEQERD